VVSAGNNIIFPNQENQQGLKPQFHFATAFGTTEVVPCYKTLSLPDQMAATIDND
jgi:hypothetical protein